MPMTWKRSLNWYANSSNTCALSPTPVSKTKVSPVPPQSRTSSWTPGSTVTKLTLCPEVSHLQTLQKYRPSIGQATRLAQTMPTAIRSQTFDFPMTKLCWNVLLVGVRPPSLDPVHRASTRRACERQSSEALFVANRESARTNLAAERKRGALIARAIEYRSARHTP